MKSDNFLQICAVILLVEIGADASTKLTSCSFDEEQNYLNCDFYYSKHLKAQKYPLNVSSIARMSLNNIQPKPVNISSNSFSKLSNVKVLFLNQNALTSLHPDTFSNNGNITWLTLNNNALTELGYRLFTNLTKLQRLEINGNYLSRLDYSTYYKQSNIDFLYAENNVFTQVRSLFAALEKNSHSMRLFLKGNPLDCGQCFHRDNEHSTMPVVYSIDGSCNPHSTSYEYRNPGFGYSNEYCVGWGSLRTENFAKCIKTGFVKGIHCENAELNSSLLVFPLDLDQEITEVLILRNASIYTLPHHTFFGMPNLWYLDLGDNHLTNLHADTFSTLKKLNVLNLENNKLSQWNDPLIFRSQSKLTNLYLNNNKLSNITIQLFEHLHNLRQVSMHSNPFTCNCFLRSTYSWLRTVQINASISCAFVGDSTLLSAEVLDHISGCESRPTSNLPSEVFLILVIVLLAVFLICGLMCVFFCWRKSRKTKASVPSVTYDDVVAESNHSGNENYGVQLQKSEDSIQNRPKFPSFIYHDVRYENEDENRSQSYCYIMEN